LPLGFQDPTRRVSGRSMDWLWLLEGSPLARRREGKNPSLFWRFVAILQVWWRFSMSKETLQGGGWCGESASQAQTGF
jgi:hypothetical protein